MSTLEAPQSFADVPETVETPPQVPNLSFDSEEDHQAHLAGIKEMRGTAVLVDALVTHFTSRMGDKVFNVKLQHPFECIDQPAIIDRVDQRFVIFRTFRADGEEVVYAATPKRFVARVSEVGLVE